MRVVVTSPCSENAPSLLIAPPISPLLAHFPCASVKTWPAWSPTGTLCWTSGLAHLPDIEFFVCAEAIATTKANSAQTHTILHFIRNLLFDFNANFTSRTAMSVHPSRQDRA